MHFYFIPSEDQLIIFSENYILTKEPAIHIAQDVFKDPDLPLAFHKVGTSIGLQNTGISPKTFCEHLPTLTQAFLSKYPKSRLYSYQGCPDKIATNEQEKKVAAREYGFDFTTRDGLKGSVENCIQSPGRPY